MKISKSSAKKLKNYFHKIFDDVILPLNYQTYSVSSTFSKIFSISPENIHKYKVSFVVPVFNGMSDGLPELINSIKNQTFKNIEIVAVDSASTDGTVSYLKKEGAKVISIKQNDFRHDFARNLGAENATGDFIVFTVQDALFFDPMWVEIAIRHLLYFNADSFCSPQIPKKDADIYAKFLAHNFLYVNGYFNKVILTNKISNKFFSKIIFNVSKQKGRFIHIDDVNHMTRRETFMKLKYKTNTCEDMDYGKRLFLSGGRFIHSSITYVVHSHRYDLSNLHKYFIRVFVDMVVIKNILNQNTIRNLNPYIIDTYIFILSIVIDSLTKSLQNVTHIEPEYIFKSYNFKSNVKFTYNTEREFTLDSDVVNLFVFLGIARDYIKSNLLAKGIYYLYSYSINNFFVEYLYKQIGIKEVKTIQLDIELISKEIDSLFGHLFSITHTTMIDLKQSYISFEEGIIFLLYGIVNYMSTKLATIYTKNIDNYSINKEVFEKLTWV